MNIVIANDQGAVELTDKIIKHLKEAGHSVNYLGIDHEESIDYPDQAEKACNEYKKGNYDFGIVCCGTGIGISIAANKVKDIRCALVPDIYSAEKAKQHNNANFIAFGGRIEYKENPLDILDAFINTDFQGGRHQRRIDKIMSIELK